MGKVDTTTRIDRWQQVDRLFDQALDLSPEEQRQLLDRECQNDLDLRRSVEKLLRADSRADDFLETPAAVASADRAGERIGAYLLVEKLGEGGMSEVYLAQRHDGAYRSRVAIKLVRSGLERKVIFDRFVAERQILARLQHPRIATLLDGGATDDGQPYLVMEHVEGEPITDYCENRKLGIRARLELFAKTCEAVDYAHRNLLVHRDIKPANILVTVDGEPKLLDFGIAKLLQTTDDPSDNGTATAASFLTPKYASPEQVRGDTVTTATDTYSLGVLLYELLTGELPYQDVSSRHRLEQAILSQSPRPPRPVARDAPELGRRSIAKDLDHIVLEALRKEPERRYRSVADLAADVRRFLARRPITARPDTWTYRLRKFSERHRLATTVASLAILGAVLFTVALAVQTSRLATQRDRARTEADKTAAALDFITALFDTAGPSAERLTVREVLDRGAERVESELADQPELQSILLKKIVEIYFHISEFERAKPLLEKNLEIRRRVHGGEDIRVAEALGDLAEWYSMNGDLENSSKYHHEALARARRVLPEDDDRIVSYLHGLGMVQGRQGDHEEAERLHREALRLEIAINGESSPDVAWSHIFLGSTLNIIGDFEGAIAEFRAADPGIRAIQGDQGMFVAQNLTNLSNVLANAERYDEALEAALEAQEIQEAIFEESNVERGFTWKALGRALHGTGDLESADAAYERAVEIIERNLGRQHYGVGITLHQWATVYKDQDRSEESERLYLEAIEILETAYGPGGQQLAPALAHYGDLLIQQGRSDLAEPVLVRAVGLIKDLEPIHRAWPRALLGECLVARGQGEQGRQLLTDSRAAFLEVLPETDERVARIDRALARAGKNRPME